MKKATQLAGLILACAVCATSVAMLAACKPDVKEYTVTFYDGTTVLDTQKVKEGEKATEWTPVKAEYEFVDWFATPNFGHRFDFGEEITEDKAAFAQFVTANQSVDTREYYIVGSGTSPILLKSDWGKVFDATTKMTKAADKNEYTYTLDLQVGDLFQFALNESWHHQRGVGYLATTKLADGTEVFSGGSTIGQNSSYRLNIKCEYSGNYTFKLFTHPDDDEYETNHANYTEENKEAFNINPADKITWTRNGDASDVGTVVTDYYLKGNGITDWKDMYNSATEMKNENGVYTLEVYLKANEEFMFTPRITVGTEVSTGTEYLRASNLDEASKEFVGQNASYNMIAKAAGTYRFTYTASTKVLSVTFDAAKTPAAADYYIDGTFADGVNDWDYCFKEQFKLAETAEGSGVYQIKNVTLKEDSEIIIQAFKEGSTERGEWGQESYNGLGSYNFTYLYGAGENFSAVGNGNNNIKILKGGVYNITFDSYAKIITIEDANAVNDAYLVGSMTGAGGWKVAPEWKMTLENGVYAITGDFAAGNEFGVRVMQGATTEQKAWFAASSVSGTPEGFDLNGNNIKCTAAGRYTITCTVTDNTAVITVTAA